MENKDYSKYMYLRTEDKKVPIYEWFKGDTTYVDTPSSVRKIVGYDTYKVEIWAAYHNVTGLPIYKEIML